MKLIKIVCIFCILATIFFPKAISAQESDIKLQVLIINQVRGGECCEPGSLDKLKQQVDTLEKLNLPAFFTLRYDVLTNPEFSNYLKGAEVKLGLFIEITPKLAADAGVEYLGNPDNWYEAQHAYTIGYNPEDRIKLADQLFSKFYQNFGYYPEITTGWMIDTPTLNYIHQKYSVKVHQITREQWGTDSYTLYGGPPHYPYPASQSWLFMPDYNRHNAPLIVRQTLTDPLFNYGDMSSSFTSQPNDYMQDGKDIEYFKSLINQALFNQPTGQVGFALIGLENSMEEKFQNEYFRQLDYLSSLDNINIVFDLDKLNKIYKDRKINIYYGKDILNKSNKSDQKAFWISTPNYRIRLRISANNVFISDYRIFSAKLEDPYTRLKAQNQGFWVAPFILDGSRWPKDRSFFEKFYQRYPWWHEYGLQAHSDTKKQVTRLNFPDKKSDKSIEINNFSHNINLSYLSNNKEVKLLFTPEKLLMSAALEKQVNYQSYTPDSFPLEYAKDNIISFDNYPLYLFPETTAISDIKPENISLFAHNAFAIAGRNPIRLILIIKNENNFPSIYNKEIKITSKNPNSKLNIGKLDNLQNGVYFVDITSKEALHAKMKISIEESQNFPNIDIYFSPDCKNDIKYCLKHPIQAYWYLENLLRDKLRSY